MCGIAGIISSAGGVHRHVLKKMTDTIVHRGPEGDGFWINDTSTVGFGHRRLSIIDLSDAAAQPMHYLGRYSIVFNGEIYNYKELRTELSKQGYAFHSASDTEVILAAYDCYKEKAVEYFDGMFAFAIWDEHEKKLFAARDRFGEKPFYFFRLQHTLFFASEMKPLWAAGIQRTADLKMLLNYITLGYVQNPAEKSQTFFQNIYSLPPANYITYELAASQFRQVQYWNIDKQQTVKITEENACRQIDAILQTSIMRRLRSDVPIGISLSGGIDSSAICTYVNEQLQASSLNCFSVIFPGFDKDEDIYSAKVANAFHLKRHTVTPTPTGIVDDFEKIAYHQEEPFSSSSIYAQYKLYELVKSKGVTVVLEGQGADEVFAGYHKYLHWYLQEVFSRNRFLKWKSERSSLAKNKIKVNWGINNIVASLLPSHASIALEKKEYQRILHHPDITKHMLMHLKGKEWEGIHKPIITKLNDILYFNTMQNGLEELLRFSDRNSMAHSVEVRLPFLRADLVRFVFSLPSDMKISNGFPKWILRKLMQGRLPDEVIWRTDKVGYEPPQKSWMQNDVLADYLFEAKRTLVNEKILKPSALRRKITPMDAHSRDNFDWRYLCAAWLVR